MQVTKFTPNTDAGEMIGTVEFSDGKVYRAFRNYHGAVRFQTDATSKHGHTSNRLFKSNARATALIEHAGQ